MRFFILSVLVFFAVKLQAQALTINSVNATQSFCYNDGTLTVNVTGGTQPYTYSIIAGPTVPNVTYPINNGNVNVFSSLHAGTYTVQVTDGAGHTATYTVAVPGNYQFPTLTYVVHSDTISVTVSLGKSPYKYAISTVGTNGPFGTYQNSDVFPNLCSGTYWIRVLDSCGNFYTTDAITITLPSGTINAGCAQTGGGFNITAPVNGGGPPYTYWIKNGTYSNTNTTGFFTVPLSNFCPDTIIAVGVCHDTVRAIADCNPINVTFCSNFTDSTANVTVTGGNGPYTYNFYQYSDAQHAWHLSLSQNNGTFTHLHYDSITEAIRFDVVDACGRTISTPADKYLSMDYSTPCPFDGTCDINVHDAFQTWTATCLDCTPQQTITSPANQFTNMDTGYHQIKIVDACGETKTIQIHLPTKHITAVYVYTSCNSVIVKAQASTSDTNAIGNCTYVLYKMNFSTGHLDSVTTNLSGIFNRLANGSYQVVVHSDSCLDGSTNFAIPSFPSYCTVPYFDPTCHRKVVVVYGQPAQDMPENYSLKSDAGAIVNEAPSGPFNGVYFNIDPGHYTLISDSGCTLSQNFNPGYVFTETHRGNCINEGMITASEQPTDFAICAPSGHFTYTITSLDTSFTLKENLTSGVTFNPIPPGTYIERTYYNDTVINYANGTILPNGNRTCPIDSHIIVVPGHTVPTIIVQNVPTCGSATTNIPFSIAGGFTPFTVSIQGLATTTVHDTFGILPNIGVGDYTMVVSDSCGISSSHSVSVFDTCVPCTAVNAHFTISHDSAYCVGGHATLTNDYTSGSSYVWTQNGQVFSTSVSPTLTLSAAGTFVIKCVVSVQTCSDSFTVTITVNQTPNFEFGSDTLYCDVFSRVLSTGVSNTQWSTGVTAASITVTGPGTYVAVADNGCGVFTDSIKITQTVINPINLGADSFFCAGDSVILNANVGPYNYQWNTGSTATQIVVHQTGGYAVSADYNGCETSDSVYLEYVDRAPQLLIDDTTLCGGSTVLLSIAEGTNPVWQDGSTNTTYFVNTEGIYIVTVNTRCGVVTDSVNVQYEICPSSITVPSGFTPNGDGVNDFFTVFGMALIEYEISIYNRWGEMVYHSNSLSELNNLNAGWDGTYKGKMQNTETFIYIINAKGDDNKDYAKKGTVTLIR